MQTTVTVDAANWLTALNTGLAQLGEQAGMASNLMCDVREDGSINVTDFRSRRVFQLRNLDHMKTAAPLPSPAGASFLESRASMVPAETPAPAPAAAQQSMVEDVGAPPTPPALLDHRVFFSRDENPKVDSNLVYRERLLAAGGASRDQIDTLLRYYFETLRRQISAIQGAHYINIALYPVEFKGRPPGPPTGALSWQDWKDAEPQVSFPNVEPARVETSYIPPEPALPVPAAGPPPAAAAAPPMAMAQPAVEKAVRERAARASTVPAEKGMTPVTTPPAAQPAVGPVPGGTPVAAAAPVAAAVAAAQPQPRPREPRRSPSQEMQIGRDVQQMDTGEILAQVFEEMQDLYVTQSQDEAADFALELAMKKIPAEAGSVFLADINTRELYFAAVRGPTAGKLKGQRLHMTKGIVGFAARRGAAIAISDVRKDPRFCNEFDQNSGFITKSVVCAPVQYEGRSYGAVEILNRRGGDSFAQGEVNVISYIAGQLAEYIATSLPSVEPDFDEEVKSAGARAPASQAKAKTGVKKKKK